MNPMLITNVFERADIERARQAHEEAVRLLNESNALQEKTALKMMKVIQTAPSYTRQELHQMVDQLPPGFYATELRTAIYSRFELGGSPLLQGHWIQDHWKV